MRNDPPPRSLPQWNAYVAAGRDKRQRRERLDEVPTEYRAQVESHVRTVFALMRKAAPRSPR